ncbi:MAG: phosphoglycerate dehydrogenase [Myxococcales bacterium]|nr:phosphoglycerate dehydrogenase [Myxococcales bacterium]
MPERLSFPRERIHIVLLESIHASATASFERAGYTHVTTHPKALDGEELKEALSDAHFVGIRSRTKLTQEMIEAAKKLVAVGCYCIGTNQVDLNTTAKRGIPVFNAPHSNTRSVAEMVLAECIFLVRGLFDKSLAAHAGKWTKSATNSYELRGKTLGIIGYGHIGSQVSILAEAFGMQVIYHDLEPKLSMGNARQLESLEELLGQSDLVTLHVPQDPTTQHLINRERLKQMKPGAMLLNASRGTVVDVDALAEAIKGGHLGGAAIDVFPTEPGSNHEQFASPLRGLPNVILTPHIGGSTQEAQANIGIEVTNKLMSYSDLGRTIGAVNFPNISLPPSREGAHRLLHIHENRAGVLGAINRAIASAEANVLGQYLGTNVDLGYVVMDVDRASSPELLSALKQIDGTIRARVVF